MKRSRLLFLLILALLLSAGYLISDASASNEKGAEPSNAGPLPRQAGDSGYLTGPNDGKPLEIALEYLDKNKVSLGLTSDDLADVVVTDQYTSKHNGVTHIYLRQRYQGIEVFNANLNINIAADGSVINVGHSFIGNLAQAVNNITPSRSALEAVESAARHLRLDITQGLVVVEAMDGPANELLLSDGGISQNNIPAKLMYQPHKNELRLVWDLLIYQKDAQHWWDIRVDGETGDVLDKNDWVVQENWDAASGALDVSTTEQAKPLITPTPTSTGNDYRVYAMPVESPNHTVPTPPADGRTLENAPWLNAPNASSNGWHDDGTSSYTITRGNNVYAYEDGNNPGFSPDGGANLVFDFPIDLSQSPDSYEAAAISNLFYWNNIIHDVWYQYGFDEVSGNFQEDNFAHGGSGSDSVNAEAQDGSGTCNANMSTPPDGGNPTMQMYVCGNRDGDLDNGVVVHEYGHGISIRLTGGPGTSSCLNNSEQGGEGWSDWFGMMMTIEAGDAGPDSRGMGTYLFGEPADGPGIRPQPYSTDMAINNFTYGDVGSQIIPHGVGWGWATMMWEMNWALIDQHGFDPDFYGGSGGNNIAMQLVIDGLKLQPCSPGFVDARDAILLADQNNNSGANQCTIWEAFAKRGLGFSASQGSSSSITDGTEAFDMPPACDLLAVTPATQDICVGDMATYGLSLGQAFTPPVTMSATGQPAGTSATFNPNPVTTVPSTTTLTIGNTASAAAGNYTITIMGTDVLSPSATTADLNVFDAPPGTTTLSQPADGATGVSPSPTFEWDAATQGGTYFLEVATDVGFTNIVYSATVDGTSHTAATSLDPLTTYYWWVRSMNSCDTGAWSATWSFATRDIPPILLVDDDDNGPDVQSDYSDVLDALGQQYDVWDTNNSDNEPSAVELAPYDMVIWFTGSEFGGAAGPGSAGEAALSDFLDNGQCLFISSQDYHFNRGLTPFMDDYLGVDFVQDDFGAYSSVTGQGIVFGGLGPYSLSYPFSDFSDIVSPDGTAELAFSGDNGNDAAIDKDSGVYRTTFFGYPFEAISSNSDRETVMQTIIDWCGTGIATGTLEGTVTDADSSNGIEGATITADNGSTPRQTTTDANGDYTMRLPIGSVDVTASATNYASDSASAVSITTDTLTTQDFALQGSSLTYSPAEIEESMEIGNVVTTTVTVTATGPLDVDFSVSIGNFAAPSLQQSPISIPASDGNFERGTHAPSFGAPPVQVNQGDGHSPVNLSEILGSSAYATDAGQGFFAEFDVEVGGALNNIAPFANAVWAGDFLGGDFEMAYVINSDTYMLEMVNTSDASQSVIGPSIPFGAESWTGMAGDPTSGMLYASSCDITASSIYTIDTSTGEATRVAAISNSPCTIAIAIDDSGQMYGYDIVNDSLMGIDQATGEGTIIGSLGFDANFGQGMDYDSASGNLYLSAFNNGTFQAELRLADMMTGNTTLVDVLGTPGMSQLGWMAAASGGSGGPTNWAHAVPDSGTVSANGTMTFDVVFDTRSLIQVGDYTAELNFDGTFVNDVPTMPLTMHLSCPTCGILDGSITDLETGDPVNAQIHITSTNGFDVMLSGESYNLAVQPGTYNFTVSANGYLDQSASVVATQATTLTTDFALVPMIAMLEFTPAAIEESMEIGDVVSNSVTVENTGYVDLEFNVNIGGYGGPALLVPVQSPVSIPASDGNFPRSSAAPSIEQPPADPHGKLESHQRLDSSVLNLLGVGAPAYGVDTFIPELLSFTTNDPANTTSIGPLTGNLYAGDFLAGDFSTLYAIEAGANTLYAIDTATGAMTAIGSSPTNAGQTWTGMAGDPTSGMMYGVSSDCSANTIYTIDVATGTPTVVGSASGVCIIDIAIGPAGDMYGLDIIADELLAIDKMTGAVTVIGSIGFDASYAQDMDFDEEANILYLAAYNAAISTAELRLADTSTGNTTLVGTIGAGELDAFGIATGGSSGSQWAHAVPDSGIVPAGSSMTFDVVFDARSLIQVGDYTAELSFDGTFVNDVPTMPLTMHLSCPTCGYLDGEITDFETGASVDAQIHITSTNGFDVMLSGESYNLAVQPDSYNITVSANGYFDESASVVATEATTLTTDFALVPMIAMLEFTPAAIEESMEIGHVVSNSVTVENTGYVDLEFNVNIGGYEGPALLVPVQSPVSIPASDGHFPRSSTPASIASEIAPSPSRPRKESATPNRALREMLGAPAYGIEVDFNFFTTDLSSFETDSPESLNVIGTISPFGEHYPAADFLNGDFTTLYALNDGNDELVSIDSATSSVTVIGPSVPDIFESWTGMAGDPTTGEMYASSVDCGLSSSLYTIDVTTGAPTFIGPITNAPCIIAIAINASGELYGLDMINDTLLWIDKATGEGTEIGSVGFDAAFSQGMDFDEESGILYLAAYDGFTGIAELRIADTTTGNTTPVGPLGTPGSLEMTTMAIATGGTSGSQWASAVPDSGIVPAGSTMTFDVVFDGSELIELGDYTAELNFSGNFVNDPGSMPLTMHLSCPTCGLLEGSITDAWTGAPVTADIHVTGPGGFNVTRTGDNYSLSVPAGSYDLTVSSSGYFSDTASVNATQGMTTTTDFALLPIIALLDYAPDSFDETVVLGSIVTRTLTISNTGTTAFDFDLSDVEMGSPMESLAIPSVTCPADAFGYTCIDSNETNGPTFDWIDISGTGTDMGLTDDSYFFPIDLPFDFNFYGTDSNQVAVGSNGAVYFEDAYISLSNQPIPSATTPESFIAVYWDDLNPSSGGAVWYEVVGNAPHRMLIVQWQEVPHYGNSSDTITAQAILYEGTNNILVQYLEPSSEAGGGATEGIQGDSTVGIEYGYNAAMLTAELSICYVHPTSNDPNCSGASDAEWLNEAPIMGTVEASAAMTIDIIFDTTVISQTGVYTANLLISGTFDNDPGTLPVIMRVEESAPAVISDIRQTNMRDVSFTVSWLTDVESTGFVRYGTDPNNLDQTAVDERGAATTDDTHYVIVGGLQADTTYYFDVVSGSTTEDNGGAHYSLTTAPAIGLPASDSIYGQVFREDGSTPAEAEGSIVYINLSDADGAGTSGLAARLSSLVNSDGYWGTNLGNARSADLSDYFLYSASGDRIGLEAIGAADGVGCERVDTANDRPAASITLNVSDCTITWSMSLQNGWNHISLPVDPITTTLMAADVCDDINAQGGNASEIDRWHNGGWEGHICGVPFNNFDLVLGSDYFIKSTTSSTWELRGYEVIEAVPLELEFGWNSIGIPHSDGYTAESLCDEMISQGVTAVEIDRWYTGGWDGHICGLSFNDFDIERGTGYFVKTSSAGTVIPNAPATPLQQPAQTQPRSPDEMPVGQSMPVQELRISNLTDSAVTFSWLTDGATTGYVLYGETAELAQVATDLRGVAVEAAWHVVTLTNLKAETTHYFKVVSGAEDDSLPNTFTTAATLESIPSSDTVYGQVFLADGETAATGTLVYLTLQDDDGVGSRGEATLLSASVDLRGYWHANLGNARLSDLSDSFSYSASGDKLLIEAQGAGTASLTVDTANDAGAPDMRLTTDPTSITVGAVNSMSPQASSLGMALALLALTLLAGVVITRRRL